MARFFETACYCARFNCYCLEQRARKIFYLVSDATDAVVARFLPSLLSTEWAQPEIPFLSPTEQSSRQPPPPIGVTISPDAGPNATVATTRTAPNRQTAMSTIKTCHPLQ